MDNGLLMNAIKGAYCHKNVGKFIRNDIKSGMCLENIAKLIENKIKEEVKYDNTQPISKGIAFPVGLSLNNCAAHYSPNYNESPIYFTENDILKIDYGVHFNGIIIDSAFTISKNTKYEEFINISRNLTNYAVSLCGPDAILGEIGSQIEEYIKSKEIEINGKVYSLRTMSDLSGHKIKPYEIHAGIAVPNISISYPYRMNPGEFYAIEPFVTTGEGLSIYKEPNSHYMLNNKKYEDESYLKILNKTDKFLLNIIKTNYFTLPFCQRWLYELDQNINFDIDLTLKSLSKKNILNTYPPIYDIKDSIISQFEHTIYVKENGIINLTKNDYY
jgi:methionyl aminopeptidase